MDKIGIKESECGQWRFWRFVEEAEFGPGLPVHTVFLVANLAVEVHKLQGMTCNLFMFLKFMSF